MTRMGPNKTVGAFRDKFGRDPAAVEATATRQAASEMVKDLDKVERGDMTREEFKKKWR